jgi:zinc transport system permease protein
MQRAFIAGLFAAVLLGSVGVFVVSRKLSFIGDGLAHASLAGIAAALLFGWAPIPAAGAVAVFFALAIYFLEKKTAISGDMAIALVFTTGMAIGIVLLSFYEGYQPELVSYLFGNILSISQADIRVIAIFSAGTIVLLWFYYDKILFASVDPVGAYLSGLKAWVYDLMLYAVTAVAVVLSIKIVGIILVSSLLVAPSAFGKLFARSFKGFIALTIASSMAAVMIGLSLSYYLNLPSGAMIIIASTTIFLLGMAVKRIARTLKAAR